MKKLKWLLLRTNRQGFGPCPEHIILRPAKLFKKLLEERTNGSIQVELLTIEQYQENYDKDFTVSNFLQAVGNNEIQICQPEVHNLGYLDSNFYVFDMPWMFNSHEHATRVFEGKIGQIMNKRLEKDFNIKGLAYTYSGGYRCIGGFKMISNLEDLQGKNLLVSNNPITKEYMESLGVKTTQRREVENDISLGDTLDARDTTYIRYPEATNFLKTNHSLFLTDIITNLDFYNSLTENEQEIFKQVALEVARTERKETTQEAKDFENTAKEKGCDIIELSQKDQEIMKAKAKELYKKWESKYFPGLINGIQKA